MLTVWAIFFDLDHGFDRLNVMQSILDPRKGRSDPAGLCGMKEWAMRRISALAIISAAAVVVVLGTNADAEELLGDPTAGRQLAHDVCAACHVIEPGEQPRSDIEAPAFPDVAKRPGITALSLRVFLQTPHDRMPDLRLSREDTDDVIAHILSFGP